MVCKVLAYEALTLADVVKLIVLDQQVMHAAHRCSDEGDAVVARVDVHEIGLQWCDQIAVLIGEGSRRRSVS